MNSKHLSVRAFLCAASMSALALGYAAPAVAQQAAPDQATAESDNGGDIVVTAQFREQRLQDTPIAITAVNAAMMEQRSQTNLSDVVKQAPSVQLLPATAAFGPSISASIRGLGQGDFNPAMEPGVGLYIDDVYYPRLTGANFDLLDVERVEVLRGPQGTLTGRNSEGGAIKFISRKPTGDGSGFAQATYGSRNRINLRAGADFKLTDTLFARISGAFSDQGGYVQNIDYDCAHPTGGLPVAQSGSSCVKDTHGDVGYRALRGILRFVPSESIDLMISADYVKDVRNQGAEVLLYANNPSPAVATENGTPLDSRFICGRFCNYATYNSFAGPFKGPVAPGYPLAAIEGDPRSRYESWGVSGNLTVKLSDAINVTSISAYREWKSKFSVDGDLSPASSGFGLNDLTHWFVSQELRLNAKLNDMIDLTVGGYYSDERTTYWTLQDIRYAAIPLQFIGNDPVNTDSKAIFGTIIVKPLDALTLTVGGRYTDEHKDYTFHRLNPDGVTINPFLGALNGVTAVYNGTRTDYRVSLDYRFAPELLAYATVSTGFKGGGVGPRPFNAAQARGFNPETVTTYEVGLKSDLFDRRLRVNLAAFFNDFKDAQLTLLSCPQFGGPGPCALPQNAGDAEQKGFEAEVAATPIDGLTIDGSLSYLTWKWKCVNPAVVGGTSGACDSSPATVGQLTDPLSGWKWAFGIQYKAELGGDNGTITPRIDVTRQLALPGNNLRSAAGSPSDLFGRVPGYTLANARLTWDNAESDLSIGVEVTNLFDKYYFINKFDLSGLAGVLSGQPGRPREWAITVKKKF